MSYLRIVTFVTAVGVFSTGVALAQQPPTNQAAVADTGSPTGHRLTTYILGPGDEIVITAIGAEDIFGRPFRISTSGDINPQLVGRIRAAGKSVEELEAAITERLKTHLRDPQATIAITQYNSQPVTVVGSVAKPGPVQLQGTKTLLEVLSMAGSTTLEAGTKVLVTRNKKEWGAIPLPTAKTSPADQNTSIAEVNLLKLMNGSAPETNIQVLPHDIINVPRALLVHVLGQVGQQGSYALNDKDSLSVMEVITRAKGTTNTASLKNAKIWRTAPGAGRIEIAVNIQKIMQGKADDPILQPEDVLYVPDSLAKGALRRTLDTALQSIPGLAIYRGF